MKDPCDECLIKVNCSELCPERKNYMALLNDAVKYYYTNSKYPSPNPTFREHCDHWRDATLKLHAAQRRNCKILRVYTDRNGEV